jgi:hypothetical protein
MHFNAHYLISCFVHIFVKSDMKILFPVLLFLFEIAIRNARLSSTLHIMYDYGIIYESHNLLPVLTWVDRILVFYSEW